MADLSYTALTEPQARPARHAGGAYILGASKRPRCMPTAAKGASGVSVGLGTGTTSSASTILGSRPRLWRTATSNYRLPATRGCSFAKRFQPPAARKTAHSAARWRHRREHGVRPDRGVRESRFGVASSKRQVSDAGRSGSPSSARSADTRCAARHYQVPGRYMSVAHRRYGKQGASRVASMRTSAIFDRATCNLQREAMKSMPDHIMEHASAPICRPVLPHLGQRR